MTDDTQICDCNAVSKAQIVDAVLRGASSLQAVWTHARRHRLRLVPSRGPAHHRVEPPQRRPARLADIAVRPAAGDDAPADDVDDKVVVTLNKVERIKKEKDGLAIVPDAAAKPAGPAGPARPDHANV